MFATTIQSQGLPGPEGVTREAGERFEFSLCLAEQNGNRWLLGIPSLREDRVTYLPTSEAQGAWVDEQSDLMVSVVTDNRIEQVADLITPTLDDLDEQVFGNAKEASDPKSGIVLA